MSSGERSPTPSDPPAPPSTDELTETEPAPAKKSAYFAALDARSKRPVEAARVARRAERKIGDALKIGLSIAASDDPLGDLLELAKEVKR